MERVGPGNSKEKQPWTTDMMREHRDKWNLAADVGVLEYLEHFGDKLLSETENTLNLLDSFETELNTSCVQVSNITNRFMSLADSQFVENRVYDDEETPTPETTDAAPSVPVKSKQELEVEVFSRLKESVNNGLNLLNSKFEAVEVANSDSEDDDSGPTNVVYKPINQFNYRPLPHLIGSVEFMKDPTLGLEDPTSDDEGSIDEASSSESKELTEENEDSEPESDHSNLILPNERADLLTMMNNQLQKDDFADLLFKQATAKRLENIENESKLPKQSPRNLFSTTPPPLEDSCDDDFGSNDDLIFGGNNRNDFQDSDDLFSPRLEASSWDDNKNDVINNIESTNENDHRKKVMQDLEQRFSQNLKNSIDDNLYNDISPSPPPLNNDLNSDYRREDFGKFRSKGPSSLFGDNTEGNEESDDLFGSAPKNITAVNSKKKIFPGSVNVFGNDNSLFKDSAKQQRDGSSIVHKSDVNEDMSKTDNDTISKMVTSIRKDYDEEDEDDDDNSIFKSTNQQDKSSSRSSSVKLSESFQDDNISIKSNKSAGLFDDILISTKKNSIKKTMDDLFSDLNNCGDGDDDLFSSNFLSKGRNLFSDESNRSGGNKTHKTKVIDDLFGEVDAKYDHDLFSGFSDQKQSNPKSEVSLPSELTSSKNVDVKKNSKPISLFEDDDDDTDIFGSDFLTNKVVSKVVEDKKLPSRLNENRDKPISITSSIMGASSSKLSNASRGLFGDEDDDLFDENKSAADSDLFSSNVFSNKESTVIMKADESKKTVSQTNFTKKHVSDDIFSDADTKNNVTSIQSSKHESNDKTEGDNHLFVNESKNIITDNLDKTQSSIPAVSNNDIKTANIKSLSLFSDDVNSDFDDGLFTGNNIPPKIIHNDCLDAKIKETKNDEHSSDDLVSSANMFNKDFSLVSDIIPNRPEKLSNDGLFNKHESSNNFVKNYNYRDESNIVPPLPDSFVDDSPLFSDDKNRYVAFGEKDDIDPFKDQNFKNDNVQEFEDKDSSNNNVVKLNYVADLTQTESDSLFEKTATTVPSEPVNMIISNNNLCAAESVPVGFDKNSLFDQNDNNDLLDKNSSGVDKSNTDTSSPSNNAFDLNLSLPKIPSGSIKKPQVPIKPVKPEPPKSLNIRAPLSVPDPFGNNSSKDKSSKTSLDDLDGCTFSSESTSNLPSPRITPGKLNLEKALNINPKALLPGARLASFKKSSSSSPETRHNNVTESSKESLNYPSSKMNINKSSFDAKQDNNISYSLSLPNTESEPVLHSLAKDRAKIRVKRRPPSRKARQEAIRQSTIENSNYEDDETDNSSSVTTQSNKEPKSTTSSIFDQPSNILSPSTDEEDLFGVPPLDLPADYTKVSSSPGDVFDAPTVISDNLTIAGSNNIGSRSANVNVGRIDNHQKKNDPQSIFESHPNSDPNSLINKPLKHKENSSDIFSDIVNTDIEDKLSLDIDKLTGNEVINNGVSNTLFSGVDDSGLFVNKSEKPQEDFNVTVTESSDLFTVNPVTSKEILVDNSPDLFSNTSDHPKGSTENVADPDLFSGESNELGENQIKGSKDDSDKSEKSKDNSHYTRVNDNLKTDGDSNIICGVFPTGVVNICDKLSITPPNDDELFPPSDWTASSKKESTIISVPEKIHTDSLFINDSSKEDDSLFFSSISSSSASKGILNISKKNVNHGGIKNNTKAPHDLFSNNDGEDDDLFGDVKSKNDISVQSKTGIQNFEVSSITKNTISKVKSKSLFGDDDEDENSLFATSVKGKSLNTKNSNLSNDKLKNVGDSNGRIVKKSTSVTKSTKLTSSKNTKGEDFIDPLAALNNND